MCIWMGGRGWVGMDGCRCVVSPCHCTPKPPHSPPPPLELVVRFYLLPPPFPAVGEQKAMFHFQKLLERNPTHYAALYKLILLLKRAGKLTDAPRFLKLAERSLPRADFDPGFKFCKVWDLVQGGSRARAGVGVGRGG